MKKIVAILIMSMSAVLGTLLPPVGAHAATAPPSFVGEQLAARNDNAFDPPRLAQVTCNPDGSGSVTYDVTGVAYGPYPGTFRETGSFTFGPAIDAMGQSNVTSFQASFRVESPVGVVHGDKELMPGTSLAEPVGYCSRLASPVSDETVMNFQAPFLWDVTITTADSVYAESGNGFATGFQHLTNQYTGQITEYFLNSTTNGPVYVAPRTPTSAEQCKKNGYVQYGIFKNQGDCIAFVETAGRNEPGQNIPG